MIDWGLVLFPIIHHPINSGEVFSVDPDGEVEWRSPKRVQATHLWVNGNPSKFLQGHNVFGSDDIVALMSD
jgi:hypothetical protein